MKRLLAALAAASLLTAPMSGCAAIHALGTKSVAASTIDDRAWASALNVYVGALQTYNDVKRRGLVPASVKAQVAVLIPKARAIRLAANAAYHAGNASDLQTQVDALKALTANLKTLTPKG